MSMVVAKKVREWFRSPIHLLFCVIICEIVGGALMIALWWLPLSAVDPDLLKPYAVLCAVGTIYFSVIATRMLRARAKKFGAKLD